MARLFVGRPAGDRWQSGLVLPLPEAAARHVQVLRHQPGDALVVFDGSGGQWTAEVVTMGRKDVSIVLREHDPRDGELPVSVTLAVGMPANDRMDFLVEKATELGVTAIQPLVCNRSVLRLDGERALKKVAHWQAVAVAASEQSGRTRVPQVHAVMPLRAWMSANGGEGQRALLSFAPDCQLRDWLGATGRWLDGAGGLTFLSGPEGGLDDQEEADARSRGWTPVGLGARVLRADTAPLMAMSVVSALKG